MSKLTATDRKDIRKLMEDKQKQLTEALGKEISSDIDQIKSRLLLKAGHQLNATQAKANLDNLKMQRDLAVKEIDSSSTTNMLEVEEARLESIFQEETTKVQQEYVAKKEELYKWRQEKKDELVSLRNGHMAEVSKKKDAFVNEFLIKNYPELLEGLSEAEKEYTKLTEFERKIRPEAFRIAQVTSQSQSRLQFLVSEATIKAKQDLLLASDYTEAIKLLDDIPSVSELIEIMEDPSRGAVGLVSRLNPQFRIALPTPSNVDPGESVGSSPEVVTEEEKEVVVVTLSED